MAPDRSLVHAANTNNTSPPTEEATACVFLAIPAELRVILYRSLFEDVPTDDGSVDLGAIKGLALARTCRQLKAEVLPFLAAALQDKPWTFRFPEGSFEPTASHTMSQFYSQSNHAPEDNSNVLAPLNSLVEAFDIASLSTIKTKKISFILTGIVGCSFLVWVLDRQMGPAFVHFSKKVRLRSEVGITCSFELREENFFDWQGQPHTASSAHQGGIKPPPSRSDSLGPDWLTLEDVRDAAATLLEARERMDMLRW
ncbi:hypothetical protein LTR37_010285 [Vermiconidia calcicola]|uniref:Uncharacterized protein n=1 Tax=Vermiconidia calcicola TaxID=1690605 RepID=A0ACC3N712_9PEZI|nr:hypothetical protein LTR37_010285 [Vermiconidia calcicola]